MKHNASRRNFLKKSAAATLTAPLIISLEEYALKAQETQVVPAKIVPGSKGTMPSGKIGKLTMSRLICGGNLTSGFAHSRDLIYVSPLLTHYFTDEKIMETWAKCEEHGIDTMILFPGDKRTAPLYGKYRERGGRIQYLAQVGPSKEDLKSCVKEAKEMGAAGAFLLGNITDAWTREGDV